MSGWTKTQLEEMQWDREVDVTVSHAARQIVLRREQLIAAVTELKRDMERVLARFDAAGDEKSCPGVNSLGEVQGSGSRVDRECALYMAAADALTVAEHAVARREEVKS